MSETKSIDVAVDEYIKSTSDSAFVTGWILVASISSPQHDIGMSDGYTTVTSDGLPHHAQLGLLQVAQFDKQSMSLLASMGAMMGEDDDWEEEE